MNKSLLYRKNEIDFSIKVYLFCGLFCMFFLAMFNTFVDFLQMSKVDMFLSHDTSREYFDVFSQNGIANNGALIEVLKNYSSFFEDHGSGVYELIGFNDVVKLLELNKIFFKVVDYGYLFQDWWVSFTYINSLFGMMLVVFLGLILSKFLISRKFEKICIFRFIGFTTKAIVKILIKPDTKFLFYFIVSFVLLSLQMFAFSKMNFDFFMFVITYIVVFITFLSAFFLSIKAEISKI